MKIIENLSLSSKTHQKSITNLALSADVYSTSGATEEKKARRTAALDLGTSAQTSAVRTSRYEVCAHSQQDSSKSEIVDKFGCRLKSRDIALRDRALSPRT